MNRKERWAPGNQGAVGKVIKEAVTEKMQSPREFIKTLKGYCKKGSLLNMNSIFNVPIGNSKQCLSDRSQDTLLVAMGDSKTHMASVFKLLIV